jgi:LysM repeat protein
MNQRIQAILGLLVLSLSFPTLTLRALDVAEEPASPAALPSESPHHATYTVVHGDSFTSVSEKFHCTIRQLKKLNGLTGITHLKAGLVLQIPSSTKKGRTFPPIAKSNDPTFIPFHTPRAVPVTDLDLPASTFASCPVPVPTDSDTPETSAVLPLAASPSLLPSPIRHLLARGPSGSPPRHARVLLLSASVHAASRPQTGRPRHLQLPLQLAPSCQRLGHPLRPNRPRVG